MAPSQISTDHDHSLRAFHPSEAPGRTAGLGHLKGLNQTERDRIVIASVTGEDGAEHVIFRLGDAVWNCSPMIEVKNARTRRVSWPVDVSRELLSDARAALYCAMRRGRMGGAWSWSTTYTLAVTTGALLRRLASLGVEHFGQVRPIHVADLVEDMKAKGLRPAAIAGNIAIFELVWCFQEDMLRPLAEHPFGGRSAFEVSGQSAEIAFGSHASLVGRTPVIPVTIQARLFEFCEARLAAAHDLLDRRDAGLLNPASLQLSRVRDAVLYVLGITGAMRNSEAMEVTNACWFEETRAGTTFYWVRTREHKTSGGKLLDYLVPRQIFKAMEILQRYAEPFQRRLNDEAQWLEEVLGSERPADQLLADMTVAAAVARLRRVRSIREHLFLTDGRRRASRTTRGVSVDVMSNQACNEALCRLAREAGVDWRLTTHQLRRTWAWNVANSRLGYKGLVFVKWQLKHASLAWSQLYAANPHQETSLYDDVREAATEVKTNKLRQWNVPDTVLSGGGGRQLMRTRGTAYRNLGQMLAATAEAMTIRNTGHSWCLSETRDCHGQGVYEPGLCGDCKQAIIDPEQGAMWQQIHLENLRLLAITDCGDAVTQKARQAVRTSEKVLDELGIEVPTADAASAALTPSNSEAT